MDQVIGWVSENRLLAAAGCLVPLLILGVVLIVWALRGEEARPTPSPPPSPPPTPRGPYLESADAPGARHQLELAPEGVTIGRAPDSDLLVTQDFQGWETVSAHHARIYRQAGRWIVEDLDSMNGVYVNGRRTGRNVLRDGWQLGIGGATFVFHAGTGESQ